MNASHLRPLVGFHFGREPYRREFVCLLTCWERSVFFNFLDDLRSSTRWLRLECGGSEQRAFKLSWHCLFHTEVQYTHVHTHTQGGCC